MVCLGRISSCMSICPSVHRLHRLPSLPITPPCQMFRAAAKRATDPLRGFATITTPAKADDSCGDAGYVLLPRRCQQPYLYSCTVMLGRATPVMTMVTFTHSTSHRPHIFLATVTTVVQWYSGHEPEGDKMPWRVYPTYISTYSIAGETSSDVCPPVHICTRVPSAGPCSPRCTYALLTVTAEHASRL